MINKAITDEVEHYEVGRQISRSSVSARNFILDAVRAVYCIIKAKSG